MNIKFSLSEISELEALELRGGTGADGSHLQCGCTQIQGCVSYSDCSHNQCGCTQVKDCQVIIYAVVECKPTGTGSWLLNWPGARISGTGSEISNLWNQADTISYYIEMGNPIGTMVSPIYFSSWARPLEEKWRRSSALSRILCARYLKRYMTSWRRVVLLSTTMRMRCRGW